MHNTQRRTSRYHRKILHILLNYKRFPDKWWQYSFKKQNIRRSSTPWFLKDGTAVSMLLATDSTLSTFRAVVCVLCKTAVTGLSYECKPSPEKWYYVETSNNKILFHSENFNLITTYHYRNDLNDNYIVLWYTDNRISSCSIQLPQDNTHPVYYLYLSYP